MQDLAKSKIIIKSPAKINLHLEVIGKRSYELTDDLIKDRAYSMLYARKFDEELENTLRSMRAEAFVEFKDLD